MHASNGQVVVVIVCQHNPTDQHSYDPAHPEELSHHVAEDPEDVGKGHLSHLVLDQESASLEEIGAEQGREHSDYH